MSGMSRMSAVVVPALFLAAVLSGLVILTALPLLGAVMLFVEEKNVNAK